MIGDIGLISLSAALVVLALGTDRNPILVLKAVISAMESGHLTFHKPLEGQ